MKNQKIKAFTLVELIVVITILAILGTIAFISLQGYSGEARDSKRLSDVNNIFKKISLERTKGTYPSNFMLNGVDIETGLTLGGTTPTEAKQGTVNFLAIKEDESNFKDPKGNDYIFSYALGGSGTGAYKFVQLATINETKNEAVLVGDYYKMETGDSESIIFSDATNISSDLVVDNLGILPYTTDEAGGSSGLPVVVNGLCGSDNGGSFTSNPINLCSAGITSIVTDNGGGSTYTWTCDGINLGTTDTCSANNTNLVNGLCGSDNGGTFTSNPTNLCSAGIEGSVTNNGIGSLYNWTCGGINLGTTDTCSANNTNLTQYPGCNETDITIGSYIISSCNVGATTAGTDWTVSRGEYFQWGRNKGFAYNDLTQQPTTINGSEGLNPSDSYGFVWGGSIPAPYTWASTDIINNWGHTTNTNIARQGPCASGYHVPSRLEWSSIITSGGWGNNGSAMQKALKLPYAGFRTRLNTFNSPSSAGNYRSTNPDSVYASLFVLSNNQITASFANVRTTGASVRCFKN